jgi:hypothetical protein
LKGSGIWFSCFTNSATIPYFQDPGIKSSDVRVLHLVTS